MELNGTLPEFVDWKRIGTPKSTFIHNYLPPSLKSQEIKQFHKEISLYFYETGTPFSRIEYPRFISALKILRPDVTLPTRKELGNKLLDECYDSLVNEIQNEYKNKHGTLITDGWSNINNEPVINYIFATPEKTYFLETIYTDSNRHTAEWLSGDIKRVIEKYSDINIVGVVTDNTNANKSAWRILQEQYPGRFFYGCNAHGLHLLVKDLFSAPTNRNENQEVEFPLKILSDTVIKCMKITKFFKRHPLEYASLKHKFAEEGMRHLKLAGDTRWGSIKNCIKEVLMGFTQIQALVTPRIWRSTGTSEQKQKKAEIYAIIDSLTFINEMQLCLNVIEPIDKQIVKFQADHIPISEVYDCWTNLYHEFESINGLSTSQINYINERIDIRWKFVHGEAHSIAFLLDPRYCNVQMEDDYRSSLLDYIVDYKFNATDAISNEIKELRLKDLGQFHMSCRNSENRIIQWIRDGTVTIITYWQTYGASYPYIQPIAIRIFSLITTTASAERNWSTHAFIHSQARNRLAGEKVEKLIYIKTNSRNVSSEHDILPSISSSNIDTETLNQVEQILINIAEDDSGDEDI